MHQKRKVPYVSPLDAFALVFLLFLLQDQLDEQLLQLLVAIVDAKLFETGKQSKNDRQKRSPNKASRAKRSVLTVNVLYLR